MTQQRLHVGLTGGIASGKSTVAECFARFGAEVIDTDAIAHALTRPDGVAMVHIIEVFGSEVVDDKGALDRAAMRARVFTDPVARTNLESILHPLIREEVMRRLAVVALPYALLVVPLLLENLAEYRPLLHRIVVVDCDESLQLARTAARAGLDIEQAKSILAVQAKRASRLTIADDLIDNQGDLVSLERQVARLHQMYLKLAANLSNKT